MMNSEVRRWSCLQTDPDHQSEVLRDFLGSGVRREATAWSSVSFEAVGPQVLPSVGASHSRLGIRLSDSAIKLFFGWSCLACLRILSLWEPFSHGVPFSFSNSFFSRRLHVVGTHFKLQTDTSLDCLGMWPALHAGWNFLLINPRRWSRACKIPTDLWSPGAFPRTFSRGIARGITTACLVTLTHSRVTLLTRSGGAIFSGRGRCYVGKHMGLG